MGYSGPTNPNPKSDEASIIIYGYVPSIVLGVVGCVTFAAAFIGMAYLARLGWIERRQQRDDAAITRVQTKDYSSSVAPLSKEEQQVLQPTPTTTKAAIGSLAVLTPCLCWALACLMEVVGYSFRCISHNRPFVVITFIIQYFMIVVAPVFICACIYFTLFAIINRDSSRLSLLPFKSTIILVFVCIDVATTMLQIVGAALIGTAESNRGEGKTSSITTDTANNILLGGLAGQCAGFMGFLTILAIVILRSRRSEAHAHLTKPFAFLFIGPSLLIFLRTLFRLVETAQGVFGYASSHEWLFGTLEFAPVFLASIWWIVAVLRWQRRLKPKVPSTA